MTVIVPTMFAWKLQWYGNWPASLNVNENDPPGGIEPDTKIPVSDVTVCEI